MPSATIYTMKLWITYHSMILFISSPSQHHGCLAILAFCMRIFHMEHCSYRTTVLDSRLQTTHPQQYHRLSLPSLLLSDYTQQLWHLPEETPFSCFVTTLNDIVSNELAQEDEGYESGSERFNIPSPLSRALQIYHVSMWEIYPSTLQTLDNHQQPQNSMQIPHLTDTEVTASSAANWCSPLWMTRALWDQANIAANIPALMTEVMTPEK